MTFSPGDKVVYVFTMDSSLDPTPKFIKECLEDKHKTGVILHKNDLDYPYTDHLKDKLKKPDVYFVQFDNGKRTAVHSDWLRKIEDPGTVFKRIIKKEKREPTRRKKI